MRPFRFAVRRALGAIVGLVAAASVARAADPLDKLIDQELSSLVATYKMLHAAPELSRHEEGSARLLATRLRGLGYDVTEGVGKYERPHSTSYGLVALMKNGAGPTVLVRTEMDALPVEEKTGLPYASQVRVKDDAGQEVGVMHACGHDLHMTSFLGVATILAKTKDQWHGTLMLIGQPAEETIEGARAMLADGLYTRFPRPDFALALHDNALMPAGTVAVTSGYALASSTSVDIVMRGIGGHGSKPESTKDPVVASAQLVMALQTIVSREVAPMDAAVVTVGSIHGGTKRNIIPDEVTLLLTVRTYKDETRQAVLASIERMARQISLAAGIPEDKAPIVRVIEVESAPATYNDPELSSRLTGVFKTALGAEAVVEWAPVMGSEDFGIFGLENHQIPAVTFWLGAADPNAVASSQKTGTPLPYLHSSLYAPLPGPSIRTGVKAMASAVLDLMKK